MGLVSGFSDVASRYNIATNGCFAINQRGLFQDYSGYNSLSESTALTTGNYICDAWWAYSITVDKVYCYAGTQSNTLNQLELCGFGKRGQIITIMNKEISYLPFRIIPSLNPTEITAAVEAYAHPQSIPFSVEVYPRNTSFPLVYVNKIPIVKQDKQEEAVTLVTYQGNPTANGWIRITLLADGFFKLNIANFREFPGMLKNPPKFAPVHPSEDLLRCKRYYQSVLVRQMIPIRGSDNVAFYTIPFNTQMVGTPSIQITKYGFHQFEMLPGTSNILNDESNWTPAIVEINSKYAIISFARSTPPTYGLLDFNIMLTATL